MDNLGTVIAAVGALGMASFGIVEGLKWTAIGLFGFGQIPQLLGSAVMQAIQVAYGTQYERLLRAHYRAGRTDGELPKALRQGARVGLTEELAPSLAESVGVVGAEQLRDVAAALAAGTELSAEQRAVLGRYELALDSRIDAALALANSKFVGYVRLLASIASIAIALIIGPQVGASIAQSVIVGIAAVPVAPLSKDLATAITSAAKALSPQR